MSESQPAPATKSGCLWLFVMLFGTMFLAYGAVRMIGWLNSGTPAS